MLRPFLFIGLGGSGGKTLRAIRAEVLRRLREQGIPVLLLERELYGGAEGQVRTRVQAFLEQITNLRRKKS